MKSFNFIREHFEKKRHCKGAIVEGTAKFQSFGIIVLKNPIIIHRNLFVLCFDDL